MCSCVFANDDDDIVGGNGLFVPPHADFLRYVVLLRDAELGIRRGYVHFVNQLTPHKSNDV